eukprot:1161697-Pelagomonas_calceolata.AAC.8
MVTQTHNNNYNNNSNSNNSDPNNGNDNKQHCAVFLVVAAECLLAHAFKARGTDSKPTSLSLSLSKHCTTRGLMSTLALLQSS